MLHTDTMPVLPNSKTRSILPKPARSANRRSRLTSKLGTSPIAVRPRACQEMSAFRFGSWNCRRAEAEKFEVTVESMARQFDEDRTFAYTCKNPGAAVAATLAKAKLFGLMTDRSVVNVTHNYAMMSEEELRF